MVEKSGRYAREPDENSTIVEIISYWTPSVKDILGDTEKLKDMLGDRFDSFCAAFEERLSTKLLLTVRDGITLERDKILELAESFCEKSEHHHLIIAYIEKCINDGILEDPEEYLHKWGIRRGNTEEYRSPEDDARSFFIQKVFVIHS